jgi:hypothetical protein
MKYYMIGYHTVEALDFPAQLRNFDDKGFAV